jgi:GTP pyrophosphokinase
MNVKNVDYNLSKCCNPQPGDPIFAFVSVTKGIRIHRCDCPNADNIRERYPYRMIPARWSKKS